MRKFAFCGFPGVPSRQRSSTRQRGVRPEVWPCFCPWTHVLTRTRRGQAGWGPSQLLPILAQNEVTHSNLYLTSSSPNLVSVTENP